MFEDVSKFGVNLQYCEFKIAVVEQRINERLRDYFDTKFNDIDNVHVRNMAYKKEGGNQELLCAVVMKQAYSRFFLITYSPYENNKTEMVGVKFNKCIELDALKDMEQIKGMYKNLNKLVRC